MLANKYKPKNKQIYLALNHLKKALAAQKKEDKKLFKEMMNYLNEVVSENSGDIFKEGKEEESWKEILLTTNISKLLISLNKQLSKMKIKINKQIDIRNFIIYK